MDTLDTITVVADSQDTASRAIENAFFSVFDRFGKLVNFFSVDSEILSINKGARVGVGTVSSEPLDVIKKAVYISDKSDGAFHATVGAEIKICDFFKKIRPSDNDITTKLPLVNFGDVSIDKGNQQHFSGKREC
jgi:FAD:protein FMN transferase